MLLTKGSAFGKRLASERDLLSPLLVDVLPERLIARCDVVAVGKPCRLQREPYATAGPAAAGTGSTQPARYVLYLVQTALRCQENPALETAATLADALGLPLFCAFPLIRHRTHATSATARHWTFALEGIAEVQQQLKTLGADAGAGGGDSGGACSARGGGGGVGGNGGGGGGTGVGSTVLLDGFEGCDAWAETLALAQGCACLIMEDMPREPYLSYVRELGAESEAPVVVVDTSCSLPMKGVGKAYLAAGARVCMCVRVQVPSGSLPE